jgi:hypothetical protein
MLVFVENTWPLWWILLVVVVLRSLRAASEHDEEFEWAADTAELLVGRRGAWRQYPHNNLISGGHVA